jgi:hypothetical protein
MTARGHSGAVQVSLTGRRHLLAALREKRLRKLSSGVFAALSETIISKGFHDMAAQLPDEYAPLLDATA